MRIFISHRGKLFSGRKVRQIEAYDDKQEEAVHFLSSVSPVGYEKQANDLAGFVQIQKRNAFYK